MYYISHFFAWAIISGLVGGFGWLLQLDDGPPKNLKIDQIEEPINIKQSLNIHNEIEMVL